MKRVTAFLLLPVLHVLAQQAQFTSSHQRQWEYYRDHPGMVGTTVAKPLLSKRTDLMETQSLGKVVYGFHPYWQNGSETNYYFSMLTHVAYFSGDVDAATGNFTNTHSWSSADVVSLAQSYGVKVHFSVVLFSDHATLLGSTSSKNNLIANIMSQINLRGADGCNIDFESIGASQATAYRDFLKQLGDTLKAYNKEFVVELFAVDWNSIFPSSFFSTLNSVVDYYFIMLYDYYYSGSSTSGPVSPLRSTTATGYHVLKSIKAYTDLGCPAEKIIAGFPSYGQDWPTSGNGLMASTTGTGSSRTYTVVKNNYIDTIPSGQQFWNTTYNTRWYYYTSGGSWRECWYDDSLSWALKFDSIKVKGVGGVGMWALGYDGTEPELWGAIKTAFASTPDAAHTSLDDFESGTGHFSTAPTFSGSTAGISTSSTSAHTNDAANNGWGSLTVVLKDNASVATNWSVRHLSGSGSRSSNTQFTNAGYVGFWMKTSSAPSGAQVALTIDDQRNGGTDKTELSSKQNVVSDGEWHLYEWNLAGSGWTSFSGGNGVLDSATLSLDAIMFYAPNGSSDWTIYLDDVSRNAAGPLPVELVSLTAKFRREDVEIRWQTATEVDNYGFEIERRDLTLQYLPSRANGSAAWEKIGFVDGAGTSNIPRSYVFIDRIDRTGRFEYRLRQIDRDGRYAYSHTVEVYAGHAPDDFTLEQNYPNPFNPTTKIGFGIPVSGFVSVKIYDAIGREVSTLVNEVKEAGIHTVQFDGSKLSSGIYFYTLRTGNFVVTKKMAVLK